MLDHAIIPMLNASVEKFFFTQLQDHAFDLSPFFLSNDLCHDIVFTEKERLFLIKTASLLNFESHHLRFIEMMGLYLNGYDIQKASLVLNHHSMRSIVLELVSCIEKFKIMHVHQSSSRFEGLKLCIKNKIGLLHNYLDPLAYVLSLFRQTKDILGASYTSNHIRLKFAWILLSEFNRKKIQHVVKKITNNSSIHESLHYALTRSEFEDFLATGTYQHSQQLNALLQEYLIKNYDISTLIKSTPLLSEGYFCVDAMFYNRMITAEDILKDNLLKEYGLKAFINPLDTLLHRALTPFAEEALSDKLDPYLFKTILTASRLRGDFNHDVMPDIIDVGSFFEKKKYRIIKLDKRSYRNYYVGELTRNCLTIGRGGEWCILDVMSQPTSCFYVVERVSDKKLIAVSYAWLSKQNALVFDSVEVIHKDNVSEYSDCVASLFFEAAHYVVKQYPAITRVLLGTGGGSKVVFKDISYQITERNIEKPYISLGQWRDSFNQVVLAVGASLEQKMNEISSLLLSYMQNLFPSCNARVCFDNASLNILLSYTLLIQSDDSPHVIFDKIIQHQGHKLVCQALAIAALKYDRIDVLKVIAQHKYFDLTSNLEDEISSTLQQTCFHLLVRSLHEGRKDILSLIISNPVNINMQDAAGNSLLLHAIYANNPDFVEFLVESGVQLDLYNDQGRGPLSIAVSSGHKHILKQLLSYYDCPLEEVDNDGHSLLHLSVYRGFFEITALLLAYGLDINAVTFNQYTALHFAVDYGDEDIVQLLLDRKDMHIECLDSRGRTPFAHAILKEKTGIVQKLLEAGSNPNQWVLQRTSALYYAVKNELFDIVELLIDYEADLNRTTQDEGSVLHYALQLGFCGIAQLLIESGRIDVNLCNNDEETPLFLAIRNNDVNIVSLLLTQGADCYHQNSQGNTPFHVAIEQKNDRIMNMLVTYKPLKPLFNHEGLTPYHLAVLYGQYATISMIFKSQCDKNIKTSSCGDTALHLAVRKKNLHMVKFLVQHGCDLHVLNLNNETPLDCAAQHEQAGKELYEFLLMKNSSHLLFSLKRARHVESLPLEETILFKKKKELICE